MTTDGTAASAGLLRSPEAAPGHSARAQRTLWGWRSRVRPSAGHTPPMHREASVLTADPTAGGALGVSAATAALLTLSLLLLL
jgi:hypothetical protein